MNTVNPDYWMGMIHTYRFTVPPRQFCRKLLADSVSALQMVKTAVIIAGREWNRATAAAVALPCRTNYDSKRQSEGDKTL